MYHLDSHHKRIRKKPNSTEIGRLYNANKVEILDRKGKWYKIKDIKSNIVGWSHSRIVYLSEYNSLQIFIYH